MHYVQIDACLPNIDAEPDEHSDSFVRWFVRLTMTSGSTTPLSQAEFDREELVLTLRDLFVGGDDTTSTNLRWILVHLANEPAILKRMQDEVDTVVGTDRLPSLDDEIKMPYTQAVILETFRRHTLLPLAMFHSTTCDTEVGGYFIPANTTVSEVFDHRVMCSVIDVDRGFLKSVDAFGKLPSHLTQW
jgi:hypothetical protein